MRTPENNELELLELAEHHLSEYDLTIYKSVQESMINNTPIKMATLIYDQVLDQNKAVLHSAVENLQSIRLRKDEVTQFFSGIYDSDELEDHPITTALKDTSVIGEIRPQALQLVVDEIGLNVNQIVAKTITKDQLKQKYFKDPRYFLMYKKRAVATTLPYDVDYKTLVSTPMLAVPTTVNEGFLTNQVLPFLRSFDENVKELSLAASRLEIVMERGCENMKDYMKTYNSLSNSQIDFKTGELVSYYLFRIGRMFIDLCNYTTFMIVRKINTFTFNVNALMELYNKFSSYYPQGVDVMHESVLDGMFDGIDDTDTMCSMVDGDASVLRIVAQRIRDSHLSDIEMRLDHIADDRLHSLLDNKISETEYVTHAYDNITSILDALEKSIISLKANSKDPYMVCDDLLKKVGLDQPLTERFASLLGSIPDIETYVSATERYQSTKETVMCTILNELGAFGDITSSMAEKMRQIASDIRETSENMRLNVNDEYPTTELVDEVRAFLNDLETDFQNLILDIVKKLMDRLRKLDSHLTTLLEENSEPEPEMVPVANEMDDFIKEAVLVNIECEKLFASYEARMFKWDLECERLKKVHGENPFFYEVGEPAPQSSSTGGSAQSQSGNTPPAQGGQQQSGGNGNQPKPGTPTVSNTDGTPAENNQGDNQKKESDPAKEGDKKKTIQDMIAKMSSFFENIIAKIRSIIDKNGAGNKRWLAYNDQALRSKKIRGKQISNLYPYADDMPKYVMTDLQACITNVKGLTTESLNGAQNNEALDKIIFGFINLSTDMKIRDKIVQWYCTKEKPMKADLMLKNSAIEKRIPIMLDYCNSYYGSLANDIANKCSELKDAWKQKAPTLSEAKTDQLKYINMQIQYYSGAIMNAIRDRAFAYISILKPFGTNPPQGWKVGDPINSDMSNEQSQEQQQNENNNEQNNEQQPQEGQGSENA